MLKTLLSELPGIWRRRSIKLICVRMWNQPAKHFAPSQSWRQSEGSSAQCSHPWAATPGGSLGSSNSLEGHLILLAHPAEGGDLLGHLDDPLDGQVSQVDHAEQERWLNWQSKRRKLPDKTWFVDVPQKIDIRVLENRLRINFVENLVDWFCQGTGGHVKLI